MNEVKKAEMHEHAETSVMLSTWADLTAETLGSSWTLTRSPRTRLWVLRVTNRGRVINRGQVFEGDDLRMVLTRACVWLRKMREAQSRAIYKLSEKTER